MNEELIANLEAMIVWAEREPATADIIADLRDARDASLALSERDGFAEVHDAHMAATYAHSPDAVIARWVVSRERCPALGCIWSRVPGSAWCEEHGEPDYSVGRDCEASGAGGCVPATW